MFIPNDVKIILDTLKNNGYESYIVGGSVRDATIGKAVPKDYDITTNALPEDIIKIFDKTVPTGIKHGTITVMVNGEGYEVTTYRIDGEYLDNRRPSGVTFVSNLQEDLARRDFTINALAFNEADGLIDCFDGIFDLKNKIIRAVGEPNKRFKEDALRMLRAIRFAASLDFYIEEKTMIAIKMNCNLISNVSTERIRDELCKMLVSNNTTKAFKLLEETNLLQIILPELQLTVGFNQRNPHHDKDIFSHILVVVEKCPPVLNIRMAGLLHDIAKPDCFTIDTKGIGHFYDHDRKGAKIAGQILRRLKFDNESITEIEILVKEHMNVLTKPTDISVKRLINRTSMNLVFSLFELQRADALGSRFPQIRLDEINSVEKQTIAIIESKAPLSIKELAVNGKDLMSEFSIKPGTQIGVMLKFLLNIVLENSELNTKDKLLSIIYNEYIKV
ncbi:CCA tRNA nucleotidyltransferase [Clostridium estertheticum]|uniref:CCA tRNA nucleotidyltransferase n=1 Tax=Clostridium estertheticum TaxID=238834 RepID=A0AA47I6F8_9CLOT|nr:CCA tRNA nucleotidyltransferase [Clostridium estertheticum]MBU3155498.1 CCA tRNA nucleotidyltransferase [Clostridium estertheticum]MBU3199582.1 CCA tRNA nucleotidyltransferase [Clostridium estertheticum]WAG60563.1 CCA tRNA nucleotidyltransferase [Clostridium estertheticum]WAG65345.1 CCA tRNA nucleotidyltransferase [Clostridium estertheticum]